MKKTFGLTRPGAQNQKQKHTPDRPMTTLHTSSIDRSPKLRYIFFFRKHFNAPPHTV